MDERLKKYAEEYKDYTSEQLTEEIERLLAYQTTPKFSAAVEKKPEIMSEVNQKIHALRILKAKYHQDHDIQKELNAMLAEYSQPDENEIFEEKQM